MPLPSKVHIKTNTYQSSLLAITMMPGLINLMVKKEKIKCSKKVKKYPYIT